LGLMWTDSATSVSEIFSPKCSRMNLRAFQISAGSARSPFWELSQIICVAGVIFITPQAVNRD